VINEILPTFQEAGTRALTIETQLKLLTEQLVTKDQQIAVMEQLNIQLQETVFRFMTKRL